MHQFTLSLSFFCMRLQVQTQTMCYVLILFRVLFIPHFENEFLGHKYLYLCRSGSRIDHRVKHRLGSKARTDYSVDPNAMGMHKQHTNIDPGRYMIGTIHGTFYMSASLDHRIANPSTPYTGHHRAYNALDTKCTPMGQLLK